MNEDLAIASSIISMLGVAISIYTFLKNKKVLKETRKQNTIEIVSKLTSKIRTSMRLAAMDYDKLTKDRKTNPNIIILYKGVFDNIYSLYDRLKVLENKENKSLVLYTEKIVNIIKVLSFKIYDHQDERVHYSRPGNLLTSKMPYYKYIDEEPSLVICPGISILLEYALWTYINSENDDLSWDSDKKLYTIHKYWRDIDSIERTWRLHVVIKDERIVFFCLNGPSSNGVAASKEKHFYLEKPSYEEIKNWGEVFPYKIINDNDF